MLIINKNIKTKNMNKILSLIDAEWVRENPDTVIELLHLIQDDRQRTQKYIHSLESKIDSLKNEALLLSAMYQADKIFDKLNYDVEESE